MFSILIEKVAQRKSSARSRPVSKIVVFHLSQKARRAGTRRCVAGEENYEHVTDTVSGRFGAYGGRYVPETLMAALEELERAYAEAQADAVFHAELDLLLRDYAGRPTRYIWPRG